GVDARDVLVARADLARFTGEAGDPEEAREMLVALLPDLERVLGAEHLDTWRVRADLCLWTAEAGDEDELEEALRVLAPTVAELDRRLGPSHREVVGSRYVLARLTAEAGLFAQARDQGTRLLRDHLQDFGDDVAIELRAQVACWTGEVGDPAGARRQLTDLLAELESRDGPEHPLAAGVRGALDDWSGEVER
ncbi:MAG TPA: hypothetical protein VKD66_14225, partial [Streptosporangiaceae bacterium]|nr:hypothetical protein [Streptosporangiaceae bacterium]